MIHTISELLCIIFPVYLYILTFYWQLPNVLFLSLEPTCSQRSSLDQLTIVFLLSMSSLETVSQFKICHQLFFGQVPDLIFIG